MFPAYHSQPYKPSNTSQTQKSLKPEETQMSRWRINDNTSEQCEWQYVPCSLARTQIVRTIRTRTQLDWLLQNLDVEKKPRLFRATPRDFNSFFFFTVVKYLYPQTNIRIHHYYFDSTLFKSFLFSPTVELLLQTVTSITSSSSPSFCVGIYCLLVLCLWNCSPFL